MAVIEIQGAGACYEPASCDLTGSFYPMADDAAPGGAERRDLMRAQACAGLPCESAESGALMIIAGSCDGVPQHAFMGLLFKQAGWGQAGFFARHAAAPVLDQRQSR